jgi:hypothetical protein
MKVRQLLVGVASIGVIVGAGAARAANTADVTGHAITCNTVTGSAKIAPALLLGGTATTTTIKVKGVLDGCTDTTDNSVKILGGKFSGTLAGNSNDCAALTGMGSGVGNLTVTWKADKATPITPTKTTVGVSTLSGGLFMPGGNFGTATYGAFSLGNPTVTGAFTGGDNGAQSSSYLVTGQDVLALGVACTPGGKGLKAISFGVGTITLK